MKTEYKLANVLKTLMSENMPLSEISVTLLVKKCKVNRQTFYYHFHDIFDLLTLVYLNERIEGLEDSRTVSDMVGAIYNHYLSNKHFVQATLASAGKELYYQFILNSCYQTILRLVVRTDIEKVCTLSERKSIARFFASGYANGIVFYLDNTKNKNLNGLLTSFNANSEDFIEKAIRNIKKVGGK